MRTADRCTLILSVAAMLVATSQHAAAQRIEGRVVDANTGAPVPSTLLRLRALSGDVTWSTVADDSGRFVLRAAQAGSFTVEAQRLGFRASALGPVRLEDGRATAIEVRLSSSPIPLDGIRVLGQTNSSHLERAGFYNRKQSGFGVFIDRSEIDRRSHVNITGLLSDRPGIRIMRGRGERAIIVLRGGVGSSMRAGSYCAARVLIDGLEADDFDLERDLNVDAIEGIEVYRSASTIPAEFSGARSLCGVVVFWLRRG